MGQIRAMVGEPAASWTLIYRLLAAGKPTPEEQAALDIDRAMSMNMEVYSDRDDYDAAIKDYDAFVKEHRKATDLRTMDRGPIIQYLNEQP